MEDNNKETQLIMKLNKLFNISAILTAVCLVGTIITQQVLSAEYDKIKDAFPVLFVTGLSTTVILGILKSTLR